MREGKRETSASRTDVVFVVVDQRNGVWIASNYVCGEKMKSMFSGEKIIMRKCRACSLVQIHYAQVAYEGM